VLPFSADSLILWSGTAGLTLWIFGFRRGAIFLLVPGVIRWVAIPLLASAARPLGQFAAAHWFWFLPFALLAPFAAVRLLAHIFERALRLLLGPRIGNEAAGFIGGILSLRLLDWITGRRRGRPIPEFEEEEHGA
jgi:hypothetical protein